MGETSIYGHLSFSEMQIDGYYLFGCSFTNLQKKEQGSRKQKDNSRKVCRSPLSVFDKAFIVEQFENLLSITWEAKLRKFSTDNAAYSVGSNYAYIPVG